MPTSLKLSSTNKVAARRPHRYQERAVEWLVMHGSAGIFAAPGAGKTAVTLKAFHALKINKVARRALVVATLRVANTVWPREPAEWVNSPWAAINTLKITVLHGNQKDWRLNDDADIFVVNFDGLKWLLEGRAAAFKALGVDTLVVDESTKLKHPRTQRFKLLKPWLNSFDRRWILTGKPIPRSYMDLFGQLYIVDQGAALGRFITHFRAQFFTPLDKMGWNWALRPGAAEDIQKRIAPYIFQLEPRDYKEIPVVENVVRVELPREARKIYDEMEEELIVQLQDRTVTAASAGAAAGKCAQIANGGLYHQELAETDVRTRTWTNIHTEKVNAVAELVDELQGEPVMVVYEFKHDLARLKKALEKDYAPPPHIGGGVNAAESARLIRLWNTDQLPVLLVHGASLAHGLNLQYGAARNIIWHSLTHDREIYDQLNMRLARQGSRHESVFVHLIVATDTVDEAKVKNLKRKGKQQEDFLTALRAYAAGRRK